MLNTEMLTNILIDSNQDAGTVDNRQKIVSKRTTRSISSVLCTETQADMHELKLPETIRVTEIEQSNNAKGENTNRDL